MFRTLTRSLWFRLLAIFVLLATVFIYGVTLALSYVYRADSLRELVSSHLALHVDYVLADIGDPPRVERAQAIVERVPVDIRLDGPGLSWASDERFPELASLRFGDSQFFGTDSAWLEKLQDVEFARTDNYGFLKLQRGDYAIVVSTPEMGHTQPGVDVRLVITVVGLASLLLCYLAVRWLFRPIAAIREGAARIGRGNFSHRIAEVRGDELGDLAADVNAMAGDVEAMLDAKRALLIGISHELRTPLSRLLLASTVERSHGAWRIPMQGQVQYQIQWPRPGRALLGIIIANVVAYILQLMLLRANVQWVSMLYLSPRDVFVDGYVWQVVTYWWMHSPMHPSHLLFNMLMLWLFGTRMETRWGQRRFLFGYFWLGLGGSVLVLLVGLLSLTEAFRPLLGSYWVSEHLGASGAATGLIVAWGLTYAEQEFNFLLLGRMKGKTLVIIIVAIEMLVALSFSNTSSASHFGGMIAAFIMVRGLWRPSRWKEWMRRRKLQTKRRNIERQLRVLDGGSGAGADESKKATPNKKDTFDPHDPKTWN